MEGEASLAAVADLVCALHATPQQAVIEVAGAGTQALCWLHAVGGSSRTVLEATDRYSHASLVSLLGSPPASAVSGAVAAAMADAALSRARRLAAPDSPVVGAACTAALATDRRRRGADRAIVAVAGVLGTAVSELAFPALPADSRPEVVRAAARQEQEAAASALLLTELAAACGIDAALARQLAAPPGAATCREFRPAEALDALDAGAAGWVLLDTAARVVAGRLDWTGMALVSGAYHPLHAGHLALGDAAGSFLGRKVGYELPLANADKAPISPWQAQHRAAQFASRAPVVLSRAPLFADKAALFPGAVFVVGADTAERLVDERFYGDSRQVMQAALAAIAQHGCGLLVAGRRFGGRYVTLADLMPRIPAPHRKLFRALPEALFRYDISSTEVRSRRAAAASHACR